MYHNKYEGTFVGKSPGSVSYGEGGFLLASGAEDSAPILKRLCLYASNTPGKEAFVWMLSQSASNGHLTGTIAALDAPS